jgi:hypothetical protein
MSAVAALKKLIPVALKRPVRDYIDARTWRLAVMTTAIPLLGISRIDNSARFAFCSLVYILLISLAHGIRSGGLLLFAMLGLAAGVYGRRPWANAKLLESANAIASAIVVIFMAVSLG